MPAPAADPRLAEVRLLLVDDHPTNLQVLQHTLAPLGLRLFVAKNGEDALQVARRARPHIVLLDVMMPGIDGFEVCRRLKDDEATRDAAIVFLSALDDTESKVRGLELGAVDFITKPFQAEEVIARVRVHATIQRLQREVAARNAELEREVAVARELIGEARSRVDADLLGDSIAVRGLREAIAEIAQGSDHVLLSGPAGAGQEAAARAIHHQSARQSAAFIHVNCDRLQATSHATLFSSLSPDASSEAGPGKLDLATGGTLFLDGIERMPAALQERLSELLSRPAGAGPDVRVVAHAALDLAREAARGAFHRPLLARISTSELRVPALSERKGDIPVLARHFAAAHARRLGAIVEGIAPASLERLRAYSWPGNVRELQGLIERAVVTARGPLIEIDPAQLEGGASLGSYRLLEKLGAGGMGEVWRARHQLLARPAAIKLVRPDVLAVTDRETVSARFQREARSTASLLSPHTVRLYDFGISETGSLYYVMELLQGLDLDKLVRRFGPLPPERAVHLIRQACRSLEEAHAAGLIHRDIKPANLYVCKLGPHCDFLKVLDFGIVKRMSGSPSDDPALTGDGQITGTPAYLAPELILNDRPLDGRADLYALGCALYFAVAGRLPFAGDAMSLLVHQLKTAPEALSVLAKRPLPPALDALALACLAKNPGERPASARELWQRLGEIAFDTPWTEERAERWWAENLPEWADDGDDDDDDDDDAPVNATLLQSRPR